MARDEADDHVEERRRQWARELPDLDTEPMAVFGRANRLAALVGPSIVATFGGVKKRISATGRSSISSPGR